MSGLILRFVRHCLFCVRYRRASMKFLMSHQEFLSITTRTPIRSRRRASELLSSVPSDHALQSKQVCKYVQQDDSMMKETACHLWFSWTSNLVYTIPRFFVTRAMQCNALNQDTVTASYCIGRSKLRLSFQFK